MLLMPLWPPTTRRQVVPPSSFGEVGPLLSLGGTQRHTASPPTCDGVERVRWRLQEEGAESRAEAPAGGGGRGSRLVGEPAASALNPRRKPCAPIAADACASLLRLAQVPTAAAAAGKNKSGWGDSPGGAGSGETNENAAPQGRRRRQAADAEEAEEESTAPTRHKIESIEDDEPASFIPDLEDAEEDLGLQVANAPTLKTSRVPTIMELDEEIDMALPSSSEVGVDLSVLQSFLTPQEHCQEDDIAWDVGHELQMIASEMTKEQEAREGNVLPGQMSPPSKKKAQAAHDNAA